MGCFRDSLEEGGDVGKLVQLDSYDRGKEGGCKGR